MEDPTTRTHQITWHDPMIGAQAALSLSGLEYMTALRDGKFPPPPISSVMNLRMAEVEHGRVVFTALAMEYHYNPTGVVHGGFAASVLDSALGFAVHTVLPVGVGYGTVELHVNLVRAITINTGEMTCEAKVIHSGRRIATAEARLTDASGRLYAHATTTCAIFPLDER